MYDDLVDTKYPFDLGHKRMIDYDRCAQFMPFSALVGYKEAVIETARITNERIVLDDEARKILDNKISLIKSKLSLKPIVIITYFVPDKNKSGGSYRSISGIIKKIDLYKNVIFINDNKIFIFDIIDVDGDIFSDYML